MPTNTNPFGAAQSAVGYLYQCRYALLLLLRRGRLSSAAEISIERFDDISFDEADSPLDLIQTKHHVGTSCSLSNASLDLWKTIRVWAEGAASGSISLSGVLLTLVTTANAPDESIASFLRKEDRNEVRALEMLIDVAQSTRNAGLQPACKAFLGLSAAQHRALVAAIYVLDNSPQIEDVLPQIKAELAYSTHHSHLDELVESVEGWWIRVVIEHLAGTERQAISAAELEQKILSIAETFHPDNLPISFCFANPPNVPDPLHDPRNFVKQLRVINCGEETISTAICDHYKSAGQRSEWIRTQLLFLGDLDQYDQRLIDEWQRQFHFVQEELVPNASDEIETSAGRRLYRWAQEQQIYVKTRCTEPIIVRGSYQLLADSIRVGWHPRYALLLNEEND